MKLTPTESSAENDSEEVLRLDTWLWAARFFKSRKLSNEAVNGGHVSVNGQRAKPAKLIRADDQLKIRRHTEVFTVIVKSLSAKRLGAPLAQALYQETTESAVLRESNHESRRNQRMGLRYDPRRPGKRDRQLMLRLKQQSE